MSHSAAGHSPLAGQVKGARLYSAPFESGWGCDLAFLLFVTAIRSTKRALIEETKRDVRL